MNKSRIFTQNQISIIKRKENNNYVDSTGNFSSRIRPKLEEILYFWIPRKDKIIKLLKKKRR